MYNNYIIYTYIQQCVHDSCIGYTVAHMYFHVYTCLCTSILYTNTVYIYIPCDSVYVYVKVAYSRMNLLASLSIIILI